MRRLLIFALLLPVSFVPAYAKPLSYKGGKLLETRNDYAENSVIFNYTLSAKDALGARVDYMRDDEAWLTTVTYSRLLGRWNTENSQANIWLTFGAGFMTHEDSGDYDGGGHSGMDDGPSAAGTIGISADWETRRWYLSYENRFVASEESEFHQSARIGIAPYIGSYNGINTWLMVQFDHRPDHGDEEFAVTPFIRLYTKQIMGEFGVSTTGDVLFNASVQF